MTTSAVSTRDSSHILSLFSSADIGDGVLGASGGGNGVTFNCGALSSSLTGGWISSRNTTLRSGGRTLYLKAAATPNGLISGSGRLTNSGFTANDLTLTAPPPTPARPSAGLTSPISSSTAMAASLCISTRVRTTLRGDADFDGGLSVNDFRILAASFGVAANKQ